MIPTMVRNLGYSFGPVRETWLQVGGPHFHQEARCRMRRFSGN